MLSSHGGFLTIAMYHHRELTDCDETEKKAHWIRYYVRLKGEFAHMRKSHELVHSVICFINVGSLSAHVIFYKDRCQYLKNVTYRNIMYLGLF